MVGDDKPASEASRPRCRWSTPGQQWPAATAKRAPHEGSCTFTVLIVSIRVESVFVGLQVTIGFGLVDAGAQRRVCGQEQFDELVKVLAERFGLKPIQIPTLEMGAMGVGGSAKFSASWTLPIGVAQSCGTLTVRAIAPNVPLLLPIELIRGLGVVLDAPRGLIAWSKLGGSQSRLREVGSGKHACINIFDVPSGAGQDAVTKSIAPRKDIIM